MSNLVENPILGSAFKEPTRSHHVALACSLAAAQAALQTSADAIYVGRKGFSRGGPRRELT